MSKYQKKGYETRSQYLIALANDNGLDLDEVLAVAEMLGVSEDFDGLLATFDLW